MSSEPAEERKKEPGLSADEFRRYGHGLVDWIAAYYDQVHDLPVCSQVEPGQIRASLPIHPPMEPESFDSILADIDDVILPGITHWQSPNFFAYFPANASYPSILGELLSAGLGVQGMMWSTSPACTELETHVLDWLVEMLGLPETFRSDSSGGGVIQDTASSATLCAMVAARERATAGGTNIHGATGDQTVYASVDAHSSVLKAAGIAGIGRGNVRLVPLDHTRGMDPSQLVVQIEQDLRDGRRPIMVCATTGTTSSMGFDPLPEIGEICATYGLWLHVDAAMAGSAAVCPEFRYLNDGLESADSYCFNPHKWLLTNFDCDCFYVRDRDDLISALTILPEYLRDSASESGRVINYRDWQVPLGRRFRALKLWFTVRAYGIMGLQEHIRRHVALASEFAGWVSRDPDFELVEPVGLSLVCFRHAGGDEVNRRAVESVNATGNLLISHAQIDGAYTIRFSVGAASTTRDHVSDAWPRIREAFRE